MSRFCTSCGQAVTKPTRFCTACGAPVRQPPPPPGPTAPKPSAPAMQPTEQPTEQPTKQPEKQPTIAPSPVEPRPDRSRPSWLLAVVAIVAAALLAGAGAAVAVVVLGGDDESTAASGSALDGGGASAATTGPETQTDPVVDTSTPNPSTSAVASPDLVRCWDGGDAKTLAACRKPTGPDGLAWLFPGLNARSCPLGTSNSSRSIYYCSEAPITIHVSYWRTHDEGASYYTDNLSTSPNVVGTTGRQQWIGIAPRLGSYKAASMWLGERWGVTVYADSESTLRNALESLRMRTLDEYRGVVER